MKKLLLICIITVGIIFVSGCAEEEKSSDMNEFAQDYAQNLKVSMDELNDKEFQMNLNKEIGKNKIRMVMVGTDEKPNKLSLGIFLDEYGGEAKSNAQIKEAAIEDSIIILGKAFETEEVEFVSIIVEYPGDKLEAYDKLDPEEKRIIRLTRRAGETIGVGHHMVMNIKMSRTSYQKSDTISAENLPKVCDEYFEDFEI